MATYPSFGVQINSSVKVEEGYEPVRATNGSLKIRRMFASPKRTFDIEHWLDSSEKSTLDTFYSTNKGLNVTLVWAGDGQSYTVRFVDAPQYTWQPWGFVTRVRLMEV